MNRKLSLILALCALVPAAILAGCGGVPGNAVAEVDGEAIEKSQFDHWMNVAVKSSGQSGSVAPDPPEYTKCVAELKKAKPAEGQPQQTDAQLKEQCKQQYEALRGQIMRLLIQFEWIEGEAAAQGIKVSDAEVKKSFGDQKKQSFPKDADYEKFLKDTGQTEEDILRRVKLDLLMRKIQEKVTKGKDKVSDQQITAYYDENKARFAQPEQRDLRIVLTKDEAQANAAKQALESGRSWKDVAKQYSIDQASKAAGGKLPAVSKGQQEKALDDAVFAASKGTIEGPVKTQFGYYVFSVEKIKPASQQTVDEAKTTIQQLLASQNQQKAVETFAKDFEKRWKDKTDCADDYRSQECKNAPKATPTPSAAAPQQTPQDAATPTPTPGK
jgi:foldase protein PrsA